MKKNYLCDTINLNRLNSIYTMESNKMNAIVNGKIILKDRVLEGFALKAVTIGEDGYTMDDILVHDAKNPNNVLHQMLAMMDGHELPLAIGVIRDVDAPNYTDELTRQIEEVKAKKNFKSLREYILSGDTWEVK